MASEGPRATVCEAVSFHRRARACPSPCLGRGNGVGRRSIFAQVERSRGKPARLRVWQARAPAIRYARPFPFTVGRGPVPRHASVGTRNDLDRRAVFARVGRSRGTGPRATVCQAASLHLRARACPSPCLGRGNGVGRRSIFAQVERSRGKPARLRVWQARAPAIRYARPFPFTVGRGPVPRRASVEETALVCVRFSRRASDRGGQAPARRAREGFSSPCAVREQALPNYSLLKVRRP